MATSEMRYLGLAADYDGTLANDGKVAAATIEALEKLRPSGRKLILVTGRELPELRTVFPRLDLADLVVAENGALLYDPAAGTTRILAPRHSPELVSALRQRGIKGISVGEVIIALSGAHLAAVAESIAKLGLDLDVIANKNDIMILPAGTDKRSGLAHALTHLQLSLSQVVGVGDAENDRVFLEACGFAVGVANAIPEIKQQVDWVTSQPNGAGMVELIDRLLLDDLAVPS